MEEETVWISRLEGKHGLTNISPEMSTFPYDGQQQKIRIEILIYCLLLAIVHMVNSNTVCMESK